MEARERSELIEAHLPLVRSLARRYAGGAEPLEDLVQAGSIGLIKAVDRFDARRGSLEPYAARVILGEIRHHMRDQSAPVRIPRRVRQSGIAVRFETLAEDDAQLAARDQIVAAEDRIALERAARALDPRERRLLALRFAGDLSQAEVATLLGLSPAHVSRLLRRALRKLRDELERPTGPAALAAGGGGA